MTLALVDLLLPRTDTGVAVQAVVVISAGLIVLRMVWHRPEWRTFVLGAWMLALSILGVRAVH